VPGEDGVTRNRVAADRAAERAGRYLSNSKEASGRLAGPATQSLDRAPSSVQTIAMARATRLPRCETNCARIGVASIQSVFTLLRRKCTAMGKNSKKRRKPKPAPVAKSPSLVRSVLRSILNNKWKVLAGVVTLLGAALGWNIEACIQEKQSRLNEYRQSLASYRAALEQYHQRMSSLAAEFEEFVTLLQGEHLDKTVLGQRRSMIAEQLPATIADCNQWKEKMYELRALERSVRELFLMPVPRYEGTTPQQTCGYWPKIRDSLDTLDINRVIHDRPYREYLLRRESGWPDSVRLTRFAEAQDRLTAKRQDDVLYDLEKRKRSTWRSVWGCCELVVSSSQPDTYTVRE